MNPNYMKKINEILEDIKFNLEYKYKQIRSFIHSIRNGIRNVFYFFPVIWKYRWWDFEFFLDIIEHTLKDYTNHYGKDSHFLGDEFVRKRACVLLKMLEKYRECHDWDFKKSNDEKKQLRRKFFIQLSNNIERFWD